MDLNATSSSIGSTPASLSAMPYLSSADDQQCLLGNVSTADDSGVSAEETANTAIIAICTSLLSLLIVVGNGLIIVSVALVKKLRQPANYLIVSLALSDFLVGFVVLPFSIVYDILGEWVFGPIPCDIHVSFDVICCTASIMNLCMISIDRYLMITKPMTYPKKRTGKLMVLLIVTAWTISCLIILPALFGFTQNVNDAPGWISFPPASIIKEEELSSPSPSSFDSAWLNGTGNPEALFDDNSSTYWAPVKNNSTGGWNFALDLGSTFRLSTVSVENAGDEKHDVLSCDLQEYVCGENASWWRSVQQIDLEPGSSLAQEFALHDMELKVLRMRITQTLNDTSNPFLREVRIFGEKAHGKACLISQQVWFTIYSTLGAFYLPLGVMLCMYWKIYREASQFNARHRVRSASIGESQEWSTNSPPSTPDALGKSRYVADRRRTPSNNNFAKAAELARTANLSEGYGSDSVDKCAQNDSEQQQKMTELTVIVTDEFERRRESCPGDSSNNVFDDDTLSSECDFLTCEKDDDGARDDDDALPESADSGKGSDRADFAFSAPLNGYYATLEASPRSRQRTRSAASFDGFTRARNLGLTDRSESTANGLNVNAEWRFPRISECERPAAPGFGSQSDKGGSNLTLTSRDALLQQHKPARTMYTRASAASLVSKPVEQTKQLLAQPRHSIFSGLSPHANRPMFIRMSSSPPGYPPSGGHRNGLAGRHHLGGRNGLTTPDRKASNDILQAISRRRSTVFGNIRRRVSLATSRERMRNVKATRTLGIIMGAFTFCWLPFFIVTFLRPFVCEQPESQDCIPLWLVRLVLWLGYLNSALNPVIYIGFSSDLRETFRLLVCCKCTNVDRRLAQTELRQAYTQERRAFTNPTANSQTPAESIM